MITEDYVSFKIAKLLKEKGFDEATHQYYKTITYLGTEANNVCIKTLDGIESEPFNNSIYGFDLNGEDTGEYACPTLQMAMKWLRETHNLFVFPFPQMNTNKFWVEIYQLSNSQEWENLYCESMDLQDYPLYEQACESGIRYCLENLI